MILINLLPHREAARKKRRELFFTQLGLSFVAGGVVAGSIFMWYQARIDAQLGRNNFLRAEIAKLDVQIKDIAGLQGQLSAMQSRQTAVEDLQADRNLPVHLLDEMVQQLPEGVYLRTLRQQNQLITITGVAQSQERVSELLRNLGGNSPWLTRPELVEIVAETVALTPQDQRRVANFTIRLSLVRGTANADVPAAAAAAGSKG